MILAFAISTNAHSARKGICIKARRGKKADSYCFSLETGRKILLDKTELNGLRGIVPGLKQQSKTKDTLIELWKTRAVAAKKAAVASATVAKKAKIVIDKQAKSLVLHAGEVERQRALVSKYKGQRITFVLIGVGVGIVVTTVVIVAAKAALDKLGTSNSNLTALVAFRGGSMTALKIPTHRTVRIMKPSIRGSFTIR